MENTARDSRELIEFLQNIVPPSTPLTISSEITLLESLGVVSDQAALKAMRTASLFVPPDAPAMLSGLIHLLTGLVRMNPQFKEERRAALDKAVLEAGQLEDFQLTFGTFLPICQKLLDEKRSGGASVRQ